MDYNEIQNDKLQEAIIKVETLQKEYEVTLQQYEESSQNYVSVLQNGGSNPCQNYNSDSTSISQACYDKIWVDQGCTTQAPNADESWSKSQTLNSLVNDSYLWATMTDETHRKGCYGDTTKYNATTSPTYPNITEYTALKGRTWWGSSGLKEGSVETQNECESMCSADVKCTGATFNPVKKYCWTRTGDGKLAPGEDEDYALLTKQNAALGLTNSLNNKLISINIEITNLLKDIDPQVNEQKQEMNTKQQKLNDSYQKLLENKMAMEKQLQDYYSIEKQNEIQSLFVNQKNTLLRFWVLITCLVLIFTLRKIYGAETLPFSIIFWLLVVIIMIILTYSLSSPSGFMMLLIVLLAIFIMKS
jgi:hypothetical protein